MEALLTWFVVLLVRVNADVSGAAVLVGRATLLHARVGIAGVRLLIEAVAHQARDL